MLHPFSVSVEVGHVLVYISALAIFMALLFGKVGKDYTRRNLAGLSPRTYIVLGMCVSIGVLISVIAHEMMHFVVSEAQGHQVHEAGITIWGAYVKPDDLSMAPPWHRFLISAAGPLTNLVIGILLLIPVRRLPDTPAETVLQCLALLNIELALFNLIPLPFVDGGQVFGSALEMAGMSNDLLRYAMGILTTIVIMWQFHRHAFMKRMTLSIDSM